LFVGVLIFEERFWKREGGMVVVGIRGKENGAYIERASGIQARCFIWFLCHLSVLQFLVIISFIKLILLKIRVRNVKF
jgi:hypothetical protein